MFSREFECPSCGAPILQAYPGSKTLVCTHCGQTSYVNADTVEAAGEQQLLIDYGSVFHQGQSLRMGEYQYQVMGRIRFDYEDGFWDEWFVQNMDNGGEAWIQEDDGSFTFFVKEKEFVKPFSIDEVQVGSTHNFWGAWEPVFISSKSKATIHGGEGELPYRVRRGEPAHFVEGIWDGKIVSVELLKSEQVLYVGHPFNLDHIQIDG